MKKAIASVLLSLIAIVSLAQQTGIAGIIEDKQTREPMAYVNIVIAGTSIGTTTDMNGYFSIDGLTAGEYILQASFIGYESFVSEKIQVQSGKKTNVNIEFVLLYD